MKEFVYNILAGIIFLGLVAMVVGALLFLANWIFGVGGESEDDRLSSRKTPTAAFVQKILIISEQGREYTSTPS